MKKILILFFILLNLSIVFGLTPNFFNNNSYYDQVVDLGVSDTNLSGNFLRINVSDQSQNYFLNTFDFSEVNSVEVVFDVSVSSNLIVTYEILDLNELILETYVFPLNLEIIDLGNLYLCDSVNCSFDEISNNYFDNNTGVYLFVDNNLDVNYSVDIFFKEENLENSLLFSEKNLSFPYFISVFEYGEYKLILNYIFEDQIFKKEIVFYINNILPVSEEDLNEPNQNIISYDPIIENTENQDQIIINDNNQNNSQSKNDINRSGSINASFIVLVLAIIVLILFIIFSNKNNRRENRKRISLFFLFLFCISFFSFVYSNPQTTITLERENKINEIYRYYRTQNTISDDLLFIFEINNNQPVNRIIENYQIIPYDTDGVRRTPTINMTLAHRTVNNQPIYSIENRLDRVYFFNTAKRGTINNRNQFFSCFNAADAYYRSVDVFDNVTIANEQETIRRLLLPRTESEVKRGISTRTNNNTEFLTNCFNFLVREKIILPYDILLYTRVELRNIPENKDTYQSNEQIIFNPPFLNTNKPINVRISFKKTPITISSQYTLPFGCENQDSDYCYLNRRDLELIKDQSDGGIIASLEYFQRRARYFNFLNQFDLVKDFNEKKVDGIDLKEVLVTAAMKRENVCFSEENKEYNEVIFDVAKAYNFTDEQALQFWAIVAEKSNCNINYDRPNDGFLGLSQTRLEDYYKQYVDLDPKMAPQLKEEENLQYLVLGDFREINTKNIEKYGRDNIIRFGGSPGKINTMYWYYEFLIKAIKSSRDKHGSLVLFAGADYLKEMTNLVNFCDNYHRENNTRNSYYNLDSFILDNTKKNMIGVFVLGNLLDQKNILKTEEICKRVGEPESIILENPILYNTLTGNYCVDNGYVPSETYPINKTIAGVTYNGSGALLYKCQNNRIYSCIPGTTTTQEVVSPPQVLRTEICSARPSVSDGRVRISKEFKILINYLAIKHKYQANKNYFIENGFLDGHTNDQEITTKYQEYSRLRYNYFDLRKETYLRILNEQNISLLKRINSNYYFADTLKNTTSLSSAVSGRCAKFVREFGASIFSIDRYPTPGASAAWTYDTTPSVRQGYNLIWESPNVCYSKPGNTRLSRNTCVETPSVQSETLDLDLLPDGAILGLYVCKQEYNGVKNLEYTHVGTYIGKDQLGNHLLIHMGNSRAIEKISDYTSLRCGSGFYRQILRVYVPRSTGITSMEQLRELRQRNLLQPITWVENIDSLIDTTNGENFEEFSYPELDSQDEIYTEEIESDSLEPENNDDSIINE